VKSVKCYVTLTDVIFTLSKPAAWTVRFLKLQAYVAGWHAWTNGLEWSRTVFWLLYGDRKMALHTYKRQLKAYLFHIWRANEQREHLPTPGAVVAFSRNSGAGYKTADLLTYFLRISSTSASYAGFGTGCYTSLHKMHYSMPFPDEKKLKFLRRRLNLFFPGPTPSAPPT